MAWLVAIVVLVGVIIALNRVETEPEGKDKRASALGGNNVEEVVETSTMATLVTEVDPETQLPYTVALSKYGSRRLQFDTKCRPANKSATFTDGTRVMIDNRGAVTHRIVIGGQAFEIPAYNFTFLTLAAETFPTTYAVDCDEMKGVMSVTVTE